MVDYETILLVPLPHMLSKPAADVPFFAECAECANVQPLEQDEGPNPIAPIF